MMLKNCEDALDRLYNSGRFWLTLDYLVDEVGILPFDVFNGFGNSVNGNKMKLCDYAEKLYYFFCDKCDENELKEKILCDLLCCSSSVQIPDVFKTKDPFYKKAKRHFIENVDKQMKVAVIRSKNQVFAVNQSKEKNLHNRYEGEFYDIDKLNIN